MHTRPQKSFWDFLRGLNRGCASLENSLKKILKTCGTLGLHLSFFIAWTGTGLTATLCVLLSERWFGAERGWKENRWVSKMFMIYCLPCLKQKEKVFEIYSILLMWPIFFPQRWVQGFPKQNVHFVNDSTICYPSGNFVIFINIETKKRTVLQCMNGIVGVVATNIPYEVVAFSDRRLRPLIYIYNFPGLTRRTKLKGIVQDPSSDMTERFCFKMWPDLALIHEGFLSFFFFLLKGCFFSFGGFCFVFLEYTFIRKETGWSLRI